MSDIPRDSRSSGDSGSRSLSGLALRRSSYNPAPRQVCISICSIFGSSTNCAQINTQYPCLSVIRHIILLRITMGILPHRHGGHVALFWTHFILNIQTMVIGTLHQQLGWMLPRGTVARGPLAPFIPEALLCLRSLALAAILNREIARVLGKVALESHHKDVPGHQNESSQEIGAMRGK